MKDFKSLLQEDDLWEVIDHLHDEIMIYDNNYKLIYVNKAAERHYGINQDELIGMQFSQLDGSYWGNSTLPEVYKKKQMVTKRQITNLGFDIITISVPIFDKDGNIKFVAQNVNDIYSENRIGVAEQRSLQVCKESVQQKEFIYASKEMHDVFQMIDKIKNVKNPSLILGETGTGKSFLARCIHEASNRKGKPFVSVNCACMSHTLMESELFGYKKGAFSGASVTGKKGIVEIADGGTLLLDEISEIPYDLQGKLLQFIQEQEFMPVGGEKKQKVDVKIIAATNRSLEQMVKAGTFRQDLYFRLNVFEIYIPPLRERKADVEVLMEHFLNHYNKIHHLNRRFSDKVKKILLEYSWSGNVREFSHMMEKIMVLASGDIVQISDVPKVMFEINLESQKNKIMEEQPLEEALERVEKELVLEAYKKYKSSVQVAKALKISQPKAYRLIKKYIE